MTRRIGAKVRGVPLFVILGLAACGSGTSATVDAPGESVLTAAVAKVTFRSDGGGFHGVPPAGAACDPARRTYVITMATHDVDWTGCTVSGAYSDPASFVPASADHALDGTQWPGVQAALANLTFSDGTGCGADKDSWTLTVQGSTGTVTYGDDFYACERQYPSYVTTESLTDLYTALGNLP